MTGRYEGLPRASVGLLAGNTPGSTPPSGMNRRRSRRGLSIRTTAAGAVLALTALALVAAAPMPVPPVLPPPASPALRAPAVVLHADNSAILHQFETLAFDADLRSGTPARPKLARWTGPLSLYVQGDAGASRLVAADAASLQPLVGMPFIAVTAGQPNVIVAIDADPLAAFAGPLRPLLTRALAGDNDATDDFLNAVVGVQQCWVLPVWADRARTTIKAAVIGVDARQHHRALQHCVLQKLAAALGLLGPDGYLPHSVFSPLSSAVRLSFEDRLMIRLLYSPELAPGLSRDDTMAAAPAVLQTLRPR